MALPSATKSIMEIGLPNRIIERQERLEPYAEASNTERLVASSHIAFVESASPNSTLAPTESVCSEPKRTTPTTETPDPILAYDLILIEEPISMKLKVERSDASRVCDRIESEEPRCPKLRMLAETFTLDLLRIDKTSPSRTMDRTDSPLPSAQKFSADTHWPMRAYCLTDNELANITLSRMEICWHDPKFRYNPWMDIAD
jgi:hypothetical protein